LHLQSLHGDVDLELFTICADAIVNSTLAHLAWLRLPEGAVQLDRLLSRALKIEQVVEKSLLEWDVERLYRAIDDRAAGATGRAAGATGAPRRDRDKRRGGSGSAESSARSSGSREDGARAAAVRALGADRAPHLIPEAGLQQAPEAEADEVRAWSERILRAHAGDGEHSMLRTLIADVARIRTPWEQVLRTQLARSLSPQLEISWSRPARSYIANQGWAGPNRRMPWTPSVRASKKVLRLIVIVDVSGSIDAKLLQRFAHEIETITRRLEAGLVLIIGDDRVRRVERFEPGRADLSQIEFHGGGGTDFTPLLDEAGRHDPDAAVILTDLEGPARSRPRWPVIWAVPEAHAHRVPPFGRLLNLH
jgi:predicted metal-dependent peptidase